MRRCTWIVVPVRRTRAKVVRCLTTSAVSAGPHPASCVARLGRQGDRSGGQEGHLVEQGGGCRAGRGHSVASCRDDGGQPRMSLQRRVGPPGPGGVVSQEGGG